MKMIGGSNLTPSDLKNAKDISKVAHLISGTYGGEAAMVLLIKGKTVGCFMGSQKEIDTPEAVRFIETTGKYFVGLAEKIKQGEVKPTTLDEETLVFPMFDNPTSLGDPGEDWSTAV